MGSKNSTVKTVTLMGHCNQQEELAKMKKKKRSTCIWKGEVWEVLAVSLVGRAPRLLAGLKKTTAISSDLTNLLKPDREDTLELDEMWTFCGGKYNPKWLWIANSRSTRQVIAYHVGDRDEQSCWEFRNKFPKDYLNLDTISDLWKPYQKVFPGHSHYVVTKGKRGTNHVERFNNTLRQRLGRLSRKTLSFSKSIKWLEITLKLFTWKYNQEVKISLN